ncbi:alpha/beta fold hydrolase [Halobaculum halobium]|uniref:Alpha/beta fold hydrolase n=1 Tax=Halobaculum halobium TaxID=3032281 RepID=A0ABD5T5M5_9EURY|nr:alpha/beta hydrolase [Halobaculum sp. SYNS20]
MSTVATPADDSQSEPHEASVARAADGRPISYTEYGRPDGAPVVFLHGTPGSRLLGKLLDRPARKRGVRVLAPDRPGYGRSPSWPDRSIRDAAEFVTPVLDDAGVETADIVGFSGGGPYALATAADRPDRIEHVDVIAGATPPSADGNMPAVQRLVTRLATSAPSVLGGLFRGQAWLAERLDPSFVVDQYTSAEVDDPISEDVAAIVRADFVEALAERRGGAVTEFRTTATDWDVDFASITPSVGLWYGDTDTNVPIDGAHWLERELPTAQLHVLQGADHIRTLTRSIPEVCGGDR